MLNGFSLLTALPEIGWTLSVSAPVPKRRRKGEQEQYGVALPMSPDGMTQV